MLHTLVALRLNIRNSIQLLPDSTESKSIDCVSTQYSVYEDFMNGSIYGRKMHCFSYYDYFLISLGLGVCITNTMVTRAVITISYEYIHPISDIKLCKNCRLH